MNTNQADVAEFKNSYFTEIDIGLNLGRRITEVDSSFEESLSQTDIEIIFQKQHLHIFSHSFQNFESQRQLD